MDPMRTQWSRCPTDAKRGMGPSTVEPAPSRRGSWAYAQLAGGARACGTRGSGANRIKLVVEASPTSRHGGHTARRATATMPSPPLSDSREPQTPIGSGCMPRSLARVAQACVTRPGSWNRSRPDRRAGMGLLTGRPRQSRATDGHVAGHGRRGGDARKFVLLV